MRRLASLAVILLAFGASDFLQAQVRISGAINFHESCCAIGIHGPSVPVGGSGRRFDLGQQREFRHNDGMHHDGFRHNRFRNGFGGFGGYPIYYSPYGYYDTQTNDQPQPSATNYEQPMEDEGPGLTVFEHRREYQLIGDSPEYRRQQQNDRYADQTTDAREDRKRSAEPEPKEVIAAATPEEVVSTILIFRDGSHREIHNYALMGNGIYDLSVKPGQGRMKILLADLDIPATVAANDQRGIEFKVPKQ